MTSVALMTIRILYHAVRRKTDILWHYVSQPSTPTPYHKPLLARRSYPDVAKEATMHELNSCSGGCVSRKNR